MKAFNPEKELRKIQKGSKNKILYGIILLLLIISIGSTYALYQVRYSKRIIYTKVAPFSNKDIQLAVYLDGSPSTSDFPTKNAGYKYDHIECDNGSTATFDNLNWELNLKAKKKDKCNVYFVKTYKDASGANAPELYQGLIPVTFGDNGKVIVANIEDEDNPWYDYGAKQWANAVLVSNTNYSKYVESGKYKSNTEIPMTEILQMYVWIPRYKYQLFNVDNESVEEQEIQIQFENNTSTTGEVKCTIDDKGKEKCDNAINDKWFTHPAFTFGDTELSGIWVSKFQASGNINDLTVKPNMSSLVSITISTIFTASKNIEKSYSTKYTLGPEEIDIHPMKNMEWGAMAFLTQSKYGRCDSGGNCEEVTINNTYVTGYANTLDKWETDAGQKASTTGNMYGIYDTNGGPWEYTMGVTMNSTNSEMNLSYSGFNTNTIPDKRYYDIYEYDAVETSYRRGHLGDATREILKTNSNSISGWYNDRFSFPSGSILTWFERGGMKFDELSGIFGVNYYSGGEGGNTTFRIVLTAQDGDE